MIIVSQNKKIIVNFDNVAAIEIILNYIDKQQDKINKAIEYIEENSFEDTTGVVLNLSNENYWELIKILKGE